MDAGPTPFYPRLMARSFSPTDLVALPAALDSHDLIALARALEAEAHTKNAPPLPEPLADALHDIKTDRDALQTVLAAVAPATGSIKEADRREDNAVGALFDLLSAWARLEGEIPQGDAAAGAIQKIFGNEGLAFVHSPVAKEWAVVDSKLKLIDHHSLDETVDALGATPILKHLRAVHKAYGEIIGTTRPKSPEQEPQVRAKKEALADAIRTYVVRVAATVDRKKPETRAQAERWLDPLMRWKSSARGKARTEEAPVEPAPEGTSGG